MIAEGALGQIYHYHARYAQDWAADPETPFRWKLQKDIAGSGAHGDINSHIIDLGRYLVGEFKEVCGQMNTFTKERPLVETPAAAQPAQAKPLKKPARGSGAATVSQAQKLAPVTVDDATQVIGRFDNGALANLEATRCAPGRKTIWHSKLMVRRAHFTLILRT